ncbi:MAG: hypothetical protein MUO43_09225 [Desulfobacterales bacterium]|nr:hypothetical protein [Desulfobacterales bacterium]
MTRPLRITYSVAIYHVTSRGNERKDIFDEVDHAAEDERVLNSWDLAIVYE